jgi:hypothetical protein
MRTKPVLYDDDHRAFKPSAIPARHRPGPHVG